MIVDDDEAVRQSLGSILQTYNFTTKTFATAREALDAYEKNVPNCIIMDVRMPGIDGLAAQRMISEAPNAPPVILITGHGDVGMAVLAMKNGAYDFIEKPIDDEKLVASINAALQARREQTRSGPEQQVLVERFGFLTSREKHIAKMVAEGYSTSAIAANLEISARTVDHHRASLSAKMQATSLPQLIRFLLKIEGY